MTELRVRHRLAATADDHAWEYDPSRRVVDIVLRGKSDDAFSVDVCDVDHPHAGCFAISRRGDEDWQILPTTFRWGRNGLGQEALVLDERPVRAGMGKDVYFVLADVPAHVELELMELSL